MADIRIVFTGKEIIVDQDPKAVMGGEPISWHICSKNPKVETVDISFEKEDARFFVTSHKNLKKRVNYITNAKGNKEGAALVWGVAPIFDDDRRNDKYTVTGNLAGGGTLVKDPDISTNKP